MYENDCGSGVRVARFVHEKSPSLGSRRSCRVARIRLGKALPASRSSPTPGPSAEFDRRRGSTAKTARSVSPNHSNPRCATTKAGEPLRYTLAVRKMGNPRERISHRAKTPEAAWVGIGGSLSVSLETECFIMKNWAGNVTYSTRGPPADVGRGGAGAGRRHRAVRALGTRHSFSLVADAGGALLSTEHLNRVVEIGDDDSDRRGRDPLRRARQRAATSHGLAVANLASLPHISVGGAIATGTHGSGAGNQSLAAAVSALELVCADGSIRRLRRGDDGFDGAVVASARSDSWRACRSTSCRRSSCASTSSRSFPGRRRRGPGRDPRGRLQRQPVHAGRSGASTRSG